MIPLPDPSQAELSPVPGLGMLAGFVAGVDRQARATIDTVRAYTRPTGGV